MRKMKRRQVYLTDEEVKIAQAIGGGNMSRGIREALKMACGLADREGYSRPSAFVALDPKRGSK